MQNIYVVEANLAYRPEVIDKIDKLKAKTIIDIGGSMNCWLGDRVTHIFDFNGMDHESNYGKTANKDTHFFLGNISDLEDWQQIFDYVDIHGKFDFCSCTHTLEDIAYPIVALRYMPKIAKSGFIAVPSKFWEFQSWWGWKFRGGVHHRWIFDNDDNVLHLFPKVNLIEYMQSYNDKQHIINTKDNTELRLMWDDSIDYRVINNDYLGPTTEHVVDMYNRLMIFEK